MLREIANQTQMDLIRNISESEFWKIIMDDQSFSQIDGNITGLIR